MAIQNLFGDSDDRAKVRMLARRVEFEAEGLVRAVDELKAAATGLPVEDKQLLVDWFQALKQDLAARV